MIMRDEQKDAQTFVLLRGDHRNRGEKVNAQVPGFLNVSHRRRPCAGPARAGYWLMDRRNPLPARVIANRLWELVFGTGIVESSENLGLQGSRPTHAELLDWLAFTFRETQAWNVKKLLKMLVTSSTFRQSSVVPKESLDQDPANQDCARFQRRRLSGEAIRDNALTAAGLIDLRMGGPPVFPVIPASEVHLFEQSLGERHRTQVCAQHRQRFASPQRLSLLQALTALSPVCHLRRTQSRDLHHSPRQVEYPLASAGAVQ